MQGETHTYFCGQLIMICVSSQIKFVNELWVIRLLFKLYLELGRKGTGCIELFVLDHLILCHDSNV